MRWLGGVMSATANTPASGVNKGIWTLKQVLQAIAAGKWP